MDDAEFQIGFWHPFGAHSNEPPEEILSRKCKEITSNEGWTLWSFQYRRIETLDRWLHELVSAKPDKVWVFCSSGKANDPATRATTAEVVDCRSYCFIGETQWRPIPDRIRVPHTFQPGKSRFASAFVVQRIIHPLPPNKMSDIEWLRRGEWRQHGMSIYRDGLPTHGEFLIRPGGTTKMRPFRAILELRRPYLAVVSRDLYLTGKLGRAE